MFKKVFLKRKLTKLAALMLAVGMTFTNVGSAFAEGNAADVPAGDEEVIAGEVEMASEDETVEETGSDSDPDALDDGTGTDPEEEFEGDGTGDEHSEDAVTEESSDAEEDAAKDEEGFEDETDGSADEGTADDEMNAASGDETSEDELAEEAGGVSDEDGDGVSDEDADGVTADSVSDEDADGISDEDTEYGTADDISDAEMDSRIDEGAVDENAANGADDSMPGEEADNETDDGAVGTDAVNEAYEGAPGEEAGSGALDGESLAGEENLVGNGGLDQFGLEFPDSESDEAYSDVSDSDIEKTEVGTEASESDREAEDAGTEEEAGTDQTEAGDEASESVTEEAEAGTEADAGSEATEFGTEALESGAEATEAGSEATESGTEALESGAEATEAGSEATESDTEAYESDAEVPEPGTESSEAESEIGSEATGIGESEGEAAELSMEAEGGELSELEIDEGSLTGLVENANEVVSVTIKDAVEENFYLLGRKGSYTSMQLVIQPEYDRSNGYADDEEIYLYTDEYYSSSVNFVKKSSTDTEIVWEITPGAELGLASIKILARNPGSEELGHELATIFVDVRESLYRLSLDANGGSFVEGYQNERPVKDGATEWLYYGNDAALREGYEMVGWATTKTATEAEYQNEYVMPGKDVTLYAVWAKKLKVSYNANGGAFAASFDSKDRYVLKNEQIHIAYGNDVATRSGYEMVGWAESKTATETLDYYYTVTKDVTLYAVWQKVYTIKFDANGGTKVDEYSFTTQTVREGDYCYPSYGENVATKKGYIMIGWAMSKTAKSPEYQDSFVPEKDMTLYAVWKKAYTVTLNANGGKFWDGEAKTSLIVGAGDAAAVNNYEPENGSYKLAGWTEAKDGSGRLYGGYSYYYPTADVTLYAQWDYPYKVKFDGNGGTLSESLTTEMAAYGDEIYLRTGEYGGTRKDYVLAGWTEDKKGTGTVWTNTYLVKKNVTLYAKWEKAKPQYTVKLNANGGTFLDEYYKSQTAEEGSYITLPTERDLAVMKGSVLLGWTVKKNKGEILTDDYLVTKNITLYAYWGEAYTVTLNGNGGKAWSDGKSVTKLTTYVTKGGTMVLPNETSGSFTRDGWTLVGWTVKKGQGTVLNGQYTPSKNITLYADWVQDVTLTLKAGEGWFYYNSEQQTHTLKLPVGKGLSVGMNLWTPYHESKAFQYWCSDKALTKPVKHSAVIKKNTTYYAKWEDRQYKVTVKNIKGASYTNPVTGEYAENSESASFSYPIQQGKKIGYLWANRNGVDAAFYFDKAFTKPYSGDYIPKGNITLYADWPEDGKDSFTIYWDANGGYSADGDSMTSSGTWYMTKDTPLGQYNYVGKGLRRDGYYFAGWYDAEDVYKKILPRSHKFKRSVRLLAKWEKGWKVTLKLAGGKLDSYDAARYLPSFTVKKKGYLQDYILGLPTPEKSGYDFMGWKSSISKQLLFSYDNEKITKAATYTATWKKQKDKAKNSKMITLTLMAGDGSIFDLDLHRYSSTVTIQIPKGTTYGEWLNLGYLDSTDHWHSLSYEVEHDTNSLLTFRGWSLKKNGKTILESNYVFNKNTTLYPSFGQENFTLVLVLNGGSYSEGDGKLVTWNVAKGTKLSLPDADDLDKEGYKFGGWYTDSAFKKKIAKPSAYKPTKSMHLYAKWTAVKVTKIVLYDMPGVKLKAFQYYDLKNHLDVLPAAASREVLTYSSSNNRVATVTDDGLVRTLSKGVAYITVKSPSKKSVSFSVSVS